MPPLPLLRVEADQELIMPQTNAPASPRVLPAHFPCGDFAPRLVSPFEKMWFGERMKTLAYSRRYAANMPII